MPSAGYSRFSSLSELTAIAPDKRANGAAYLLRGTRDWFVFDNTSSEAADYVRVFPPDTGTGRWYRIGGTMGYQDANAVAITGGNITGITPLGVAAGGTGVATVDAAREALGIQNPNFNYAVNGDFQSAQAGATFTAVTVAGHLMEMWRHWSLGTNGVATISRQSFTNGQTDVPNNPLFFLRWAQTTAASSNPVLAFTVEDVRTQAGQWMTVSFYARAAAAVTVGFFVRQSFGTSGTPSADVNTATQNNSITTAWTRFVYTVQMPSVTGKTLGTDANTSCLRLFWTLPIGSTFTFEIADLKVEAGQVATPVQRTIDDAFRVYRYYQAVRCTARFVAAAAGHTMEVHYPLYRAMRGTPTTTLTSSSQRLNMAAGHPQVASVTGVGGRFLIAAAAAGDAYAIYELLVMDARL